MLKHGAEFSGKLWRHKYGITMGAYLAAAVLTGSASVLFMRAFERALSYRLDFDTVGAWCWVTTPLLFLASVEL
ncbi:MAG: hypothetical protein NUW21_00850, partial [Elusimicrobia bacterium]|nr:hypothetical protein [Elusimicrobiota bacterium]